MKSKVTVRYEVEPLDMDGVIAYAETGTQLMASLLELLPSSPIVRDRQRLDTVYALAYGVQRQLQELERHADATLAAEYAKTEREEDTCRTS